MCKSLRRQVFGRMVVVGVGRADKFGRIVGKRAGRVAKVEDG